jgi:hypothetical protein
LAGTPWGQSITVDTGGLKVTLAPDTDREVVAEVNRLLVEGGVSVYRLQEVHASLESWFLEVTSRLGQDAGEGLGAAS